VDLTTSAPADSAGPIDNLTAVAGKIRRGMRLFNSSGSQPRARRATDLIMLVLSMVGLVFAGLVAVPEPGISKAISQFLSSLPVSLGGTWQVMADLPLAWALVLLVAAFVGRRTEIGRDMLLSAITATVMWLLVARIVNGSWPDVDALIGAVEPPPEFPAARLSLPAALLITASPHLVRPARRLGYLVLVLGSIATITLGATSTLGVVAALLAASAAAAILHLALGSSSGRPSLDDVRFALADMNVAVSELGVADRQDAGQFAVAARGADGAELVVKLYGRDAHDAAIVSTVWRSIWLRRPGSPVGFGRLRQVEHEALLTLLARQAGVRTDAVITAGKTSSDDAVLVLHRTGTPMAPLDRFVDVDPDDAAASSPMFTGPDADRRLAELWQLVDTLHDSGIAHGQLDEDHLYLHDGAIGLVGFRGASVAPTDAQLGTDEAQMLVTTVGLFGRERAVQGLVEHRSTDRIEALLPYLQPTALTGDQRRMTKVLDLDLDDLRSDVAAAAGVESPPLIRLRRFTVGSVIRIALPALALFMLVSAFAGFDWSEFVESLQDASWWIVLVGFVVAQTPRVAQAIATLGAAPIPLPLGPVYALQLAISYVNLAIPTTAARIAVNIRFFQRQGVSPTAAVATGALDGVSGFIVQAILLVSLLLFSSISLDLDVGSPSSDAIQIIVVAVIVAAIILIVVLAVPRFRHLVVGTVRHVASEAWTVLRGLRSPRRVAMLFGGNLAAELLFAFALGVFLLAFGQSLGFAEILFVNMAVSLFAGMLPIPGGIGVTEGGLIFGLTSFGVPQETAFAAVMLYRLATFYLPPIWGFFSLNWLERRRYL
jgi:uncharacterized membrane protein YbhN (UPF0104 family)